MLETTAPTTTAPNNGTAPTTTAPTTTAPNNDRAAPACADDGSSPLVGAFSESR